MTRTLAFLLALTVSLPARARPKDELSEALTLLRGRVVFVDQTAAARVTRFGGGMIGWGLMIGVAALVGPYVNPSYRNLAPVGRKFYWFPAGLVGLGGLTAGYGQALRRAEPPGARAPKHFTHYQSAEGLTEFMGLTHAQQYALAERNPDFADFLIRLAEAYRFVTDHRVTPLD